MLSDVVESKMFALFSRQMFHPQATTCLALRFALDVTRQDRCLADVSNSRASSGGSLYLQVGAIGILVLLGHVVPSIHFSVKLLRCGHICRPCDYMCVWSCFQGTLCRLP